jgi:hypothetical protein
MQNPSQTDREQLRLLLSPVGAAGSGLVRYGAAMHFWRMGAITPQLLEIYRKCARRDGDDPREVARHEGVVFPAQLSGMPVDQKNPA